MAALHYKKPALPTVTASTALGHPMWGAPICHMSQGVARLDWLVDITGELPRAIASVSMAIDQGFQSDRNRNLISNC